MADTESVKAVKRGRAAGVVSLHDMRRRVDSFLVAAQAMHQTVTKGIVQMEKAQPAPSKRRK